MNTERRWRRPLAGGVPWGFITEVSGLGMSLLTFIVVGERLGPSQFGSLAALLATILLVGPLLTASPEHVVVQRIAQRMPVTDAWKRSIAVLTTAGPIVACTMVPAASIVAPAIGVGPVILISLGEVAFLGLARVAIRAHEANGESRRGAWVAMVTLASRALALGAFALEGSSSVESWAMFHGVASVAAACFAHWSLGARKMPGRYSFRPSMEDYRLGLPFALNSGPDSLLSNNDKMVLSGSGLDSDAGIYAAAYRIASIAGVPARSVLRIRYASYFKVENQSAESSVQNALSIVRATAPAGIMSGLALFAFAPVARWVLGEEFGESVSALRFLAFLPFIRSVSTPGANVLTGTGRQRLRIAGTLGAAIINLCLNLLFIPSYGWQAAAVTTLVAEVLLLAWVWVHVFRPVRQS